LKILQSSQNVTSCYKRPVEFNLFVLLLSQRGYFKEKYCQKEMSARKSRENQEQHQQARKEANKICKEKKTMVK
jgi:hypothetical protein